MATKKKKAAKKRAVKKAKELTAADVFKLWGVGPKDKILRKFIVGQRKVNGRLYMALDKMGDALKAARAGDEKKHNSCLDIACNINDKVPGVPPGCDHGGLPGGGGR